MEELPLLLHILSDMIHIKAKAPAYVQIVFSVLAPVDHNTTGGLSCAFI